MVRANCANRNAEIHAPFHPIRRPEDRRSMHPPRPLEAERVARWLSGQRRAGGLGGRCPRVSDAHPRDARLRRSLTPSERGDRPRAETSEPRWGKGAADGASTTYTEEMKQMKERASQEFTRNRNGRAYAPCPVRSLGFQGGHEAG